MMIQDPMPEVVKKRLRMARAKLGVSQREAAARAGISQSVLEKYESRDNERIPNTRQLFRLASLYDLSIDYILGRDVVEESSDDGKKTNGTGKETVGPIPSHN